MTNKTGIWASSREIYWNKTVWGTGMERSGEEGGVCVWRKARLEVRRAASFNSQVTR